KKQQPRRKQRKEAEVSHDESEDEDHVPTPSGDPLPSGDDSSILNELMVFCTSLQEQRKSRSRWLRILKKIGSCKRVKSLMEKDSLGAQEDASKQERMIEEIDQNTEIALDTETQGRTNDNEMFGVDDLAGEKVVMETTTGVKDSAAPITDVTEDEITMAQALAALKSTKAKVVVQEAKGIVFHEQKQSQIPTVSSSKDKGKAKMIEPEVSIKKKDQMRIDEELLAKRLQAREKEELSEVQKARFLVELIKKRKKHFATLRAQEKRNKPPTKTQMKSQMSTYLKHMGGYKQYHLKGKSFNEIKELFDREITKKQKVNKNVKLVIDDSEELKKCMEIVPDDGDKVLIEATPISSRSPTIIDYKFTRKEKRIISRSLEQMEKPMDDMDNLLFRTLKTMFEHHVEDTIWKYQQGLAKVYPLIRNTLHQLWSDVRLQVDHDVEMAYDLLRFIKKELMEGYTPQ
nr:hypothetical protein [Tanacetum cinerariifolium]